MSKMQIHRGSSLGRAAPAFRGGSTCLKVMLLAICLITALLWLRVGQLAHTGIPDSSAAVHLKRRLEEGEELVTERRAFRRTPGLFSLQPGGVSLPCSVDSHGVLQNASKARDLPKGLTGSGAAAVMIPHPGHARREEWPCHSSQDFDPKDLTGLSTARAQRASVPPDFDWHMYLVYHPELRDLGVDSDKLAREHYMYQGRAEVLILSCCGLLCLGPGNSVSTQPAMQQLSEPAVAQRLNSLLAALSWPCWVCQHAAPTQPAFMHAQLISKRTTCLQFYCTLFQCRCRSVLASSDVACERLLTASLLCGTAGAAVQAGARAAALHGRHRAD